MADKKFTIALEGKVSPSVQKVLDTMEKLHQSGVKGSKAMQTLSGGGTPGSGPPGAGALAQGGIAKALLAQKNLFDGLGASGAKLAKVLNEQVTRAQVNLQKALQANATSMTPLTKQYEATAERITRLSEPGASPAALASAQRRQQRIARLIQSGMTEREALTSAGADIGLFPPPLPGAPAGGAAGGGFGAFGAAGQVGGRMLMGASGIPFGGAMMAAGGAIATTALVAAAAVVALKVSQVVMKGNIGFEAGLGSAEAERFGLERASDTRAMYGRMLLQRRPELGQDIIPLMSPGGIFRAAGSGIAAAPQLLSLDLSPWGIAKKFPSFMKAAGTKYDEGTKQATTGREKELGEALGAMASIGDEQFGDVFNVQSMMRQYGSGSWSRSATTAARYRLAPGTFQGYMGGVKGSVGAWNASGYAEAVAQLERQGMDPSRAMGIISRNAVGRGGFGLRGTGLLDPTLRAIIGEGVGGTMGIEGAMWQGKGAALSERLGGGGITDATGPLGVFQAQQAVGGAAMAGRLYGGHDAYQKSYNIAASSAALGAGADPYQRQALANLMSDPAILSAVLNGEHPAVLTSMGISKTAAQTFARDVSASTTTRWMDSGGTYAAAEHMRKAKSAGGIQQYLENIKDPKARELAREQLAPLLAQTEEGLTGGTVGGAMQYMRFASGGGATGRRAGAKRRGESEEAPVLDRLQDRLDATAEKVYNFGVTVEVAGQKVSLSQMHRDAGRAAKAEEYGLRGKKVSVPAGKG